MSDSTSSPPQRRVERKRRNIPPTGGATSRLEPTENHMDRSVVESTKESIYKEPMSRDSSFKDGYNSKDFTDEYLYDLHVLVVISSIRSCTLEPETRRCSNSTMNPTSFGGLVATSFTLRMVISDQYITIYTYALGKGERQYNLIRLLEIANSNMIF